MVVLATVGGNPECMVGKREDRTAMSNTVRVAFPITIHLDTGIAVAGLGDVHAQQPAKSALLKFGDSALYRYLCRHFRLTLATFHTSPAQKR